MIYYIGQKDCTRKTDHEFEDRRKRRVKCLTLSSGYPQLLENPASTFSDQPSLLIPSALTVGTWTAPKLKKNPKTFSISKIVC